MIFHLINIHYLFWCIIHSYICSLVHYWA